MVGKTVGDPFQWLAVYSMIVSVCLWLRHLLRARWSTPTGHADILCSSGTVLLHLLAAAMGRRTPTGQPCKPIPALYIPVPSPFATLETFIYEAAEAYHLELFHHIPPEEGKDGELSTSWGASSPGLNMHDTAKGKGVGMKHALAVYKERFPHIEAILIGTRRTDPHGGMCASTRDGAHSSAYYLLWFFDSLI